MTTSTVWPSVSSSAAVASAAATHSSCTGLASPGARLMRPIRRGAGSRSISLAKSAVGGGATTGSPGSSPAHDVEQRGRVANRSGHRELHREEAASARRARSRPTTRPREVLSPTSPHTLAGMRIDPPPSLACAQPARGRAATAAAEPPLDPPGERVGIPRVARRTPCGRFGGRHEPELGAVGATEVDETGASEAPREVRRLGAVHPDSLSARMPSVWGSPAVGHARSLVRNGHAAEDGRVAVTVGFRCRVRFRTGRIEATEHHRVELAVAAPRCARSPRPRARSDDASPRADELRLRSRVERRELVGHERRLRRRRVTRGRAGDGRPRGAQPRAGRPPGRARPPGPRGRRAARRSGGRATPPSTAGPRRPVGPSR